jgi:hypothetical protein
VTRGWAIIIITLIISGIGAFFFPIEDKDKEGA